MFLAEIGTAGVMSAYFFRHITSAYSLNVPDPIEGQPVLLSYSLCVFGCGLVFWLLVLSRAKLHGSGDRQADIRNVAKRAKLITSITILNLCGCLLASNLPLLVFFLVIFQMSSSLALILIWIFLLLKECMILLDAHTRRLRKSLHACFSLPKFCGGWHLLPLQPNLQSNCFEGAEEGRVARSKAKRGAVHNVDGVDGKVDEAGGSGSGHGSGASGREENRGRYGGSDGGGGAGGGGDRGESGHGSGAGGHGRDEGGTGSGHGSGAGGSGENRGGSEGGDRGRDGGGGGADPECGGRGTNTEQGFKSSKITEMSLMLTAQTTSTLIGYHITSTPSSSSKALLVVALMDQLVAYLCGLTSILLISNKPEDSKAAKTFEYIGFVCTALGFILMVAMFLPWYLVLIAVLLFGVVWLIFFRNGLISLATEGWNYLKNERNQ